MESRDDYRKSVKMIEELRTNILELHAEIKTIKQEQTKEELQTKHMENIRESMRESLKEEVEAIRRKIAKETSEMAAKL